MNARAKMSSKGQVVIPKEVRVAHGLETGVEFDVDYSGRTIVLTRLDPLQRRLWTVDEVAGFIKHSGPPVSVEDMNAVVASEAKRMWRALRG